MGFRVYLTHSEKHEAGFFQAKGENAQLHRAISTASDAYLRAPSASEDQDKMAELLEKAWDNIAGDVRRKSETVVSPDKRLVVEIYRS